MTPVLPTQVLCALLLATPALAQDPAHPARLDPGDTVLLTHHWDADSDTWQPAEPTVLNSCWRVVSVTGQTTRLELVSGLYHPFWADAAHAPGYQDDWIGNDEFYSASHPSAPPREMTQGLFTTVAGCPAS